MKAMVNTRYGGLDVFELKGLEKPTLNDNVILVKVYATIVNAAVKNSRKGIHPDSKFFTLALKCMDSIPCLISISV